MALVEGKGDKKLGRTSQQVRGPQPARYYVQLVRSGKDSKTIPTATSLVPESWFMVLAYPAHAKKNHAISNHHVTSIILCSYCQPSSCWPCCARCTPLARPLLKSHEPGPFESPGSGCGQMGMILVR